MDQANKERYQKMEYHYCSNSGLKLPILSLGLWYDYNDNGVLK